ncbi:hypothetical protein P7C73_g3767, partial [Tremellales sp. Uapishka_1]
MKSKQQVSDILGTSIERVRLPTVTQLALAILAYLAYAFLRKFVYKPLTSPLKKLQCAPGGETMMGHVVEFVEWVCTVQSRGAMADEERLSSDCIPEIDTWINKLGKTFRAHGCLWVHDRLCTIDARAVSHILGDSIKYEKPAILRKGLTKYMRTGMIVAEGERHRIQRKVVQRLFGKVALKRMSEVIQIKADQMRDILVESCQNPAFVTPFAPAPDPTWTAVREIDFYSATSRWAYDIVGQLAIDHSFDSLGNYEAEGGIMFDAYEKMQQLCHGTNGLRSIASITFPFIDQIYVGTSSSAEGLHSLTPTQPSESAKRASAAMDPLEALSKRKIEERIKEIQEGSRETAKHSQDLLTLMLLANMSKDLPPDQKLYPEEITGQLATFLFAGSETTAGTITFLLHHLALQRDLQSKLREECLGYGEALPFDKVDDLEYLDAVVKEALRVNPSIIGTVREAMQDDVIPLAEPIKLRDGSMASEVKIRKGQYIHIPIESLNTSTQIWGPSAAQFDPSRWMNKAGGTATPGSAAGDTAIPGPGVWPNLMTFIDGPRRCVGYKLAMLEIKLLLFVLVRTFEFAPVPGKRILKWNLISTRPFVEGTLWAKGSSLPLMIRVYKPEKQ